MLTRCLHGGCLLSLALLLAPAAGQTMVAGDGVPVYFNGELLVRFRTWTAEYSPAARAELFEQRLRDSVGGAVVDLSTAQLRNDGGQPTLVLGDQRLVTITPADAAANQTTPWRLARAWQANLKAALANHNAGWTSLHRSAMIDRSPPPDTHLIVLNQPLPRRQSDHAALTAATGATDPVLNGVSLFTFRADAGGFTAEERYAIFQHNLQMALDQPVDRRDVQLRWRHGEPTLQLAGHNLCTVTWADAAANYTTPLALAQIWAGNLRQAVAGIDRH